jgi:hypothetical protein
MNARTFAVMMLTVLLISVVVSIPSAHASTAWLLWSTYQSKRTETAIQRAFETQRACEDAIPSEVHKQLRVYKGLYRNVYISPADGAAVVAEGLPESPLKDKDGDSLIVRLSCWPLGLRPLGLGGAEYVR